MGDVAIDTTTGYVSTNSKMVSTAIHGGQTTVSLAPEATTNDVTTNSAAPTKDSTTTIGDLTTNSPATGLTTNAATTMDSNASDGGHNTVGSTMGQTDATTSIITSVTAAVTTTTVPPDPCDPNPCEHGGTCQKDEGSFNCTCTEGYDGTKCEKDK